MTDPTRSPADVIGTYVVTDADGIPSHVLNLDQFEAAGKRLAFALGAVCDDSEALHRTVLDAVDDLPREAWPFVSMYALKALAENVLLPVLIAARGQGDDLIVGIRAIAEALNKEGGR